MKMRRFFYDTEFIEEPGFLELISIGIVDENRTSEFYVCNADADLSRANSWVKENVIPNLPPVLSLDNKVKTFGEKLFQHGDEPPMEVNHKCGYWFDRKSIARLVLDYLKPSEEDLVELWGYYSAYDHVILCWLFGKMIDLPKGMPMYTMDIKQLAVHMGNPGLPEKPKVEHHAISDAHWNLDAYLFLKRLEGEQKERHQ